MRESVNLTNNNTNNTGGSMILNHQNTSECSLSTLSTNFTNVIFLLQKVVSNASISFLDSISTSASVPYRLARPSAVCTSQNLTKSIGDSMGTVNGVGVSGGANDSVVNHLPGSSNGDGGGQAMCGNTMLKNI